MSGCGLYHDCKTAFVTPRDCDIEGVDVFGDGSLQVVKDDRKLCLLGRGNARWGVVGSVYIRYVKLAKSRTLMNLCNVFFMTT